MEDKSKLSLELLSRRLERIHSAIIALTAAMENGCGHYEPAELTPALEELAERTYDLAKETGEAAEAGLSICKCRHMRKAAGSAAGKEAEIGEIRVSAKVVRLMQRRRNNVV